MGTTDKIQHSETQTSPPSPAPARRARRPPRDLRQAVLESLLPSGQNGYCEGSVKNLGQSACRSQVDQSG